MACLHPQASHPGRSYQEDSTFRLHIVLLIARLFLIRFEAIEMTSASWVKRRSAQNSPTTPYELLEVSPTRGVSSSIDLGPEPFDAEMK